MDPVDKLLLDDMKAVGTKNQDNLRKIQNNLDARITPLVEKDPQNQQAFSDAVSKGFFVERGEKASGPLTIGDMTAFVTGMNTIFADETGAKATAINPESGYRQIPVIKEKENRMNQGDNQIKFLAKYYVNELRNDPNKDSLVVLNILGNNSREGTTLAHWLHEAMMTEIMTSPDILDTDRQALLDDMAKRTVFLNTGAAGKAISENAIAGWAIMPEGKTPEDKAWIGDNVFSKDDNGVYSLQAKDIVLPHANCNLKQFTTDTNEVIHLEIAQEGDKFYASLYAEGKKDTPYISHQEIRAAGKIADGTPAVLIGSTEAELSEKLEHHHFANRMRKVKNTANEKGLTLPTSFPVLTEGNSTNTGENVSMGADKLVEHWLKTFTAEQQHQNVARAFNAALDLAAARKISIRIVMFPKNDKENALSASIMGSASIVGQLSEADAAALKAYAGEIKPRITAAMEHSHFASTQTGQQCVRALGTVNHQLKNPLDASRPAFASSTMLLSLFDPRFLQHRTPLAASFDLIGYVKEFWVATKYLMTTDFFVADPTPADELMLWKQITCDVLNAYNKLENENSVDITVEELDRMKVDDIIGQMNKIWGVLERNAPTIEENLGATVTNLNEAYRAPFQNALIADIEKKRGLAKAKIDTIPDWPMTKREQAAAKARHEQATAKPFLSSLSHQRDARNPEPGSTRVALTTDAAARLAKLFAEQNKDIFKEMMIESWKAKNPGLEMTPADMEASTDLVAEWLSQASRTQKPRIEFRLSGDGSGEIVQIALLYKNGEERQKYFNQHLEDAMLSSLTGVKGGTTTIEFGEDGVNKAAVIHYLNDNWDKVFPGKDKNTRLIVSDFDGTLRGTKDADNMGNSPAREAIQRYLADGGLLVVNTGNDPHRTVQRVLAGIPKNDDGTYQEQYLNNIVMASCGGHILYQIEKDGQLKEITHYRENVMRYKTCDHANNVKGLNVLTLGDDHKPEGNDWPMLALNGFETAICVSSKEIPEGNQLGTHQVKGEQNATAIIFQQINDAQVKEFTPDNVANIRDAANSQAAKPTPGHK